jgi:RHS repeat-associated protein
VGGLVLAQQESGTWGYVLPDHLGSVRQVANGAGQATLAQSYTPYGEVLHRVGSASSAFAFTGEPMDVTGMIHLRARYYAPTMGGFTRSDPFAGWATTPYSLHPYQYG